MDVLLLSDWVVLLIRSLLLCIDPCGRQAKVIVGPADSLFHAQFLFFRVHCFQFLCCLSLFVLFYLGCSYAQVLLTTLVHEFHILYS